MVDGISRLGGPLSIDLNAMRMPLRRRKMEKRSFNVALEIGALTGPDHTGYLAS